MKISVLFLIPSIIGTSARSNHLRVTKRRHQQVTHDEYFECTVKVIHGMPLPGSEEDVPPSYICDGTANGDHSYLITGDDVDSFFEGEDLSSGVVSLNVPYSAVGRGHNEGIHSTIDISVDNSKQIFLTYDRRRKLNPSGQRKVLVLRVSDDGSANAERKITQSTTKMYWDVFGDENNLKKVYRNCSGGQLNIMPATGSGVNRGVITVPPPQNVCNMYYIDVGNYANNLIKNLGIDRTNTMIVMPDCVNFGRGSAWGEMNGSFTWFPSRNASFPMTQVHEFGHNLGMGHSNGDYDLAYADGTCYMGNLVPWTDKGAKMCFNAAKMWYFGWFSKYHSTNKPEKWGLSKKLIGIAEAHNRGHLVSEEKAIVRVQRLDNTSIYLFLMYNHKMGPNNEVIADENKIVISEQALMSSMSSRKAALGAGQEYRQKNWGKDGNTLVVKNCGLQKGSWGETKRLATAHVIVYVEGKTYKSCTPQRSETDSAKDAYFENGDCTDFPGFHDFYGEDYTCTWYGQAEYLCNDYGSGPRNDDDLTPNEACCVCGGGNRAVSMQHKRSGHD